MLTAVMRWNLPRLDRAALLVAAVALIAYLPGFWWGAPTATAADRVLAWGVDDSAPLGPLAEMHNIIQPKPDRNLGYPLLHDFVAASAYAPYLVTLRVTGRMHGISAVYPFGLNDPASALRVLTLINHLLSVLFGVIVVVAAFDAARTLWGAPAGMLSAAFVQTLYPMFYYARTGNVDVPMLAFLALAVAALARALVHGMAIRRAVWVGIFAGLTLATKEAAVGALLPAAAIVLVLGWRAGGWKVPALALLASLLALGLGSGLFVDPHRWAEHVRFIGGRASEAPVVSTRTAAFPYPFTLAGHLAFVRVVIQRMVEAMSLPGLVLALAGAIVASWRDRRAACVALAIPGYAAVQLVALRSTQLRYVLPSVFLLALFAGWAVAAAWRSGRASTRTVTLVLATAALALQVAHGTSLTYEMVRDSRHAAGAWLAVHLRPGDHVEYFGASDKLPPLPREVSSDLATPFRGMWAVHETDSTVANAIRRRWSERPPAVVLVIPDHSSAPGLPYDASMPPSLYETLTAGTAGYRLAAFFQTPPLIPWLPRPALDYPSVNPPIRIFAPLRSDSSAVTAPTVKAAPS